MDWYLSLPAAEATVPCGAGMHPIRWEAGRLLLPAHPDPEAELVLAALGGEKARCIEVTDSWARHSDDLDVLMTGPRSRADKVTIGWDEAEEHRANWLGVPPGLLRPGGPAGPGSPGGPGSQGGRPGGGPRLPRPSGGRLPEELLRRVQERTEMLQLLALGPALQFRLAGTVAAAWACDGRHPELAKRKPELVGALTGRAAPALGQWLGIDPGTVTVTPPAPPGGWGTLEVFGTGRSRRLRASLPVGWLASVWACGLAVVSGHFIVAVEEAGWPKARVLALPEPGATPVTLDVVGTDVGPLPEWHAAP